jgi:hypothetical protein
VTRSLSAQRRPYSWACVADCKRPPRSRLHRTPGRPAREADIPARSIGAIGNELPRHGRARRLTGRNHQSSAGRRPASTRIGSRHPARPRRPVPGTPGAARGWSARRARASEPTRQTARGRQAPRRFGRPPLRRRHMRRPTPGGGARRARGRDRLESSYPLRPPFCAQRHRAGYRPPCFGPVSGVQLGQHLHEGSGGVPRLLLCEHESHCPSMPTVAARNLPAGLQRQQPMLDEHEVGLGEAGRRVDAVQ